MLTKSCIFDVFDVSSDLFRKELPSNVSLHVQDARTYYPQEHHGKFDAVHLRLLVAEFYNEDWALAIEKAVQLLKSGGAMQYASAAALQKVIGALKEALMYRFKWGYNILSRIFKERGSVGVKTEVVSCDRVAEMRQPLAIIAAAGAIGWARKKGRWSESELTGFEEQLDKEVSESAYSRYDVWATICFKPTS
ncbi:MAG: hypothetical protein Q9159_005266 [Coniocarpon cinnabarinum]